MPRPSKRVSPNTLGGMIRSARQNLHLSLAEVAGEKYSTSLISQIERNRIDPSAESLQYLAEQLKLPLDNLTLLAQQSRDTGAEESKIKDLDEKRAQAAQMLADNRPRRALEQLQDLNLSGIPPFFRWRIVALRGQCYFSLRQFQLAQSDFLSAVAILPEAIPQDQHLEATALRLHLAAATRELGQIEVAYAHYQDALAVMNDSTPVRFVAEAHWGIALVVFELANNASNDSNNGADQSGEVQRQEQNALKHAKNARILYSAIDEPLRAALLDCQIALIEQALGNLGAARVRLQRVLDTWASTLEEAGLASPLSLNNKIHEYSQKERANLVSAAACYLASVEHADNKCERALVYIQLALDAGKKSYTLRRAEAYMMKGRILADIDIHDPQAEEAFRAALKELEPTDRVAAKIRAHDMLGRYLLKQGRSEEGDRELDKAQRLAKLATPFSATTSAEDTPPSG